MISNPVTSYAKSGDVHIAYQAFGDGPIDLVLAPGFVSHIETYWDEPNCARWLNRLAGFSRLIIFDKRSTGLSDRVSEHPDMDTRMDDMRAVMDAVGVDRAVVMGISEGGSLASLFAAHHQARCQALILYGAFAQFSSWLPNEEVLNQFLGYIDNAWGSGESLPMIAPSLVDDAAFKHWWGKLERLGASPGSARALMLMNSQIDTTAILPTIHVPTLVIHRTEDVTIDVEAGRLLADRIPNARLFEIPGKDHLPWVGDTEPYMQEIELFLTGEKSAPIVDRVLATVLFTDIVDSTSRAETLGDRAWRDLLASHDRAVRAELARFRGNEVKSLGDGFLITFDGPARAIQCAHAINNAVRPLGIDLRIGLHTGEVELAHDDVRGIAVHIAARVANYGTAGEVVVTRTVKDLVAGSGIAFDEVGEKTLKGVPDKWQLFRVS